MSTTIKMLFMVGLVLGAASAARASGDTDHESGGFQVQTWQDIAQAKQNILNQIAAFDGKSAYGFVSPSHKSSGTKH